MKNLGDRVIQIERLMRRGMEMRAKCHPNKTVDDLEREFAFAEPHPEDSEEIKIIRPRMKAIFEITDDARKRKLERVE